MASKLIKHYEMFVIIKTKVMFEHISKLIVQQSLWGPALQTVAYLLNKVPSKSVMTSPHEMWTCRKPSLDHIRVWGCPAYVKRINPDKLEDRSFECRFIGYPCNST